MKLYFHPLSTYSQKTLVALYEKGAEFAPEIVDLFDPTKAAKWRETYPLGKVPVLVDGDRFLPESSIIIEYVDGKVAGSGRLIPEDKELARKARFFDRTGDLYLTDPTVSLFKQNMRPEAARDADAVASARRVLDLTLGHLDKHLDRRSFLVGESFTMADCAHAPGLALARHVHGIDGHPNVARYWNRLAERPSVRRVLDEAAPYLKAMAK